MSGIEGEVLTQFFDALAKNEQIAESVVEGLKSITGERLPGAATLTELFTTASGDTVA